MNRDVPDALASVVGEQHVLVDPDERAGYEIDWTRRFHGRCAAVVRPGSTAEVSAVLTWCRAHGLAVVPQGGNTGLVGGGVPSAEQGGDVVVLSTRRLTQVGDVDAVAGRLIVGAGVTLAGAVRAVEGSGWDVAVDLGARDTATIGGMVATNAGGTRVVRHGMMRRNVVGLEAVLPDGSVISDLRGLEKDNTGYDLTGLLCGSEGTLGVVTRVALRLVPREPDRLAVLVRCRGWEDAVALSTRLRLEVQGIEALEAVDRPTAELVARALDVLTVLPASDGPPVVSLLVEWAGTGAPAENLVGLIGDRDHAVAIDDRDRERLWATRDRATEAIATTGIPHKLDVTVPLRALAVFVDEVTSLLAGRSDVTGLHVFGHVGDGNLHVNVVGPQPDDDGVDTSVLALVAAHGGSISAEHGIGRLKRPYLHLNRSSAEIAAFRAIKGALDPTGICNPGVILEVRPTDPAAPAPA